MKRSKRPRPEMTARRAGTYRKRNQLRRRDRGATTEGGKTA